MTTYNFTNNDAFIEQVQHERFKDFMASVGWSTVMGCADPADIFEFVEEHGEDADFGELAAWLANK